MYSKIDNIEQFRCEKPGLELHYTPIQAPVSALIDTARSKLIILSSKFEISTKSWVKLSLHWPFWANPFKIFIFNVPKQQKCTFEGHDLVMPWGVRGFQAFISSLLLIFWSKKLIWLSRYCLFLLLLKLRLGAQSSYVVKYFEGSNAVKTTSMRNNTPFLLHIRRKE